MVATHVRKITGAGEDPEEAMPEVKLGREHLATFDEACSTPPATTAPVAMSDFRRDAFEVGRRMSAAKRAALGKAKR
jgi:hypothetical protein